MRHLVLAVASLWSFIAITQVAAEGDWHIGCETPEKCSYYRDNTADTDHTIRHLSSNLKHRDDVYISDPEHYDTRCKPDGTEETIERFNGTDWVDFYLCYPAGSCTDLHGHGSCNIEPNVWVVPGKSFLTTFECDGRGIHGTCTQTGTGVPIIVPPSLYKRHSFEVKTSKRVHKVPTRCNPVSDKTIQYWFAEHSVWINFHTCITSRCINLNSIAAAGCVQDLDILVPHPNIDPDPTDSESSVSSDESDDPFKISIQNKAFSGVIQTRCDPADPERKRVQYLTQTRWQWFYACHGTCVQLSKFAACQGRDGQKYSVPVPSLPSRALRSRSSFNTRCNPTSKSEVQRFDGKHWIHLYTCEDMETCTDFEGHVYCHVQSPVHIATKCNSHNESEVVSWHGRSWDISGVCIPPYICGDVSPGVNFAVCKHPNGKWDDVWLPWPYLASPGSSGVITRCSGPDELVQFDGQTWIPYRYCGDEFVCERAKDTGGAQNDGCVAKDPEAVQKAIIARLRRAIPVNEDPDHYEPFGFDHRSQGFKTTDTGMHSARGNCAKQCNCSTFDNGCWANCGHCLHDEGHNNLVSEAR